MDFTISYVMAALGTTIVLFWAILFLMYKDKYDNVINAVDRKKFILSEIFFIGFGIIDLFKIDLNSAKGRAKKKIIAEVHGNKYAHFYHFVIMGGKITYALTLIPLGLFLGAISNDIIIAILGVAATFAIVAYLDVELNNAVQSKREDVLEDLPVVLSKLTLLVNAGLVIRDAWAKVALSGDGPLYEEMQITSNEMLNGVSDMDALYNFSQRIGVKEIRKFSSTISQNLQKGGTELANTLKHMTAEGWEEKKHRVKRKGELAGQKLLIPTMIMFAGIMIMIVVPIFANMFQ